MTEQLNNFERTEVRKHDTTYKNNTERMIGQKNEIHLEMFNELFRRPGVTTQETRRLTVLPDETGGFIELWEKKKINDSKRIDKDLRNAILKLSYRTSLYTLAEPNL